jgi:hypothetical protein
MPDLAKIVDSRRMVLGALVGLALLMTGFFVDWKRLPVEGLNHTLNDQVGYISVARHWLDEGKLDSSIIYPSLLEQKLQRNSLYMPGFYAELALTFRVIGYSALTARIPALINFLLACAFVYWIALRMYGQKAAINSVALFAFFPLNLFYAFTAMAEMPLVVAALAAFSLFLILPEKFQWLGSLALALPILFRETGIAIGVVMCAMIFFGERSASRREAILCGLLVCLVLVALVLSPAGAGRPSMWKANILAQGRFEAIYTDAFAVKQLPDAGTDWMAAFGLKFFSNLYLFFRGFFHFSLESAFMLFLLSGIPLGLWLWRRKRDRFALGVALSVSLLFMADLCVYTVWYYRGIRTLLLIEPFVAVLWGITIGTVVQERGKVTRNMAVTMCFVAGVGVALFLLLAQRPAVTQAKEDTSFMESAVGNSKQLVVSPWWLSLDYVNEHYPQRWALVPANCPTMNLLDLKDTIGTLIVPAQPGIDPQMASCGTPLRFSEEKTLRGTRYAIFRREEN